MPFVKQVKQISLSVLMLLSMISSAQNWEFGGLIGGSYYFGDVTNEPSIQQVRYSGGIFARYHLSERLSLRGNFIYARIVGIDSLSSSDFQINRNLNFFTDIYECSFQAEFNLLEDLTRGRRIKNRVVPYLFAGLGGFYFVPQTNYLGKTWNLAQLQTSGTAYSQVAACIPLGIGVRCYMTPNWLIGLEVGARYTTTSNLDDIAGSSSVYPDPAKLPSDDSRLVYDRNDPTRSANEVGYGKPGKQRGKVDVSDVYFIFGVTISYKMGMVGGRRFQGKAIRCPRFY
jgi:hypothetical protein